jgi:hypothetical protein
MGRVSCECEVVTVIIGFTNKSKRPRVQVIGLGVYKEGSCKIFGMPVRNRNEEKKKRNYEGRPLVS